MTISFVIEKSDLKKFNHDYYKYSPTVKKMNYFTYLLIVLFSIYNTTTGTYEVFESVIYVFVYHFIIMFILIKSLQFIFMKLSIALTINKANTAGVLGEHTITISDENVTEQSLTTERKDHWRAINDVIKREKHIYIICDQGAYIVPLRAFQNEVTANEFFVTALNYLKKAKAAA